MPSDTERTDAVKNVRSYLVEVLLVFLAYFAAGKIGLSTPFTSHNISPVWPASGVALTAVLLFGYRVWPGIVAAAFLVNLGGLPGVAALGLACGNTLGALTGGFLLKRAAKLDISLSRMRDVLTLIGYGALVSTMVSASIGTTVLFATHIQPWSGLGFAWLTYWLGDAMGVLLMTPLLLTLPLVLRWGGRARFAELMSLLGLLIVVCFLVFVDRILFPIKLDVLGFAVFPFVLWAAIRFGVGECALSTLVIATIATAATAMGEGPFAQGTPLTNALLLQAFFGVLSFSGLTLAAVTTEREDLESARQVLVREQVLREARLQLAAVVECSSDAIISTDMEGRITHWNQGAEHLYGYSGEEVAGKSIALLMPIERSDDFCEIMQTLRAGGRVEHFETVRIGKDGTRVDVSTSVSPILNIDGKVVGTAAIARDISGRKQTEEALRKAEKLSVTGRLAAAVAHELNNPLETLSNLVYLLRRNESLDSNARECVEIADEELRRAAHVTRQMLAFHRHSSKPASVNLPEVLDDVADLYAPLARSNDVAVEKRFEAGVAVCAVSSEIRQVFANVLRNAIEAVPQGGTITLHVFGSREWNGDARSGARVVIADNGSGISLQNREKIFEPFFTTKGEHGTGLGLWVSSGIILKHGGSIRVRSSLRQGRSGTVFNVFLPYEAAQSREESSLHVEGFA